MAFIKKIISFVSWRLFPPKTPYMLALYHDGSQEADLRISSFIRDHHGNAINVSSFDQFFSEAVRDEHAKYRPVLGVQMDRAYEVPDDDGKSFLLVCRTEKDAHSLEERFLRTAGGRSSYDVAPSNPGLFIWWNKKTLTGTTIARLLATKLKNNPRCP